jgi:hypothetical protein
LSTLLGSGESYLLEARRFRSKILRIVQSNNAPGRLPKNDPSGTELRRPIAYEVVLLPFAQRTEERYAGRWGGR